MFSYFKQFFFLIVKFTLEANGERSSYFNNGCYFKSASHALNDVFADAETEAVTIFILILAYTVRRSIVRFKHVLEVSLGDAYACIYYLYTEVNLSIVCLDLSLYFNFDLIT
jgi:hypothetical protein